MTTTITRIVNSSERNYSSLIAQANNTFLTLYNNFCMHIYDIVMISSSVNLCFEINCHLNDLLLNSSTSNLLDQQDISFLLHISFLSFLFFLLLALLLCLSLSSLSLLTISFLLNRHSSTTEHTQLIHQKLVLDDGISRQVYYSLFCLED